MELEKEVKNLDIDSTLEPSDQQDEVIPELNSSPLPTTEQVENAGMEHGEVINTCDHEDVEHSDCECDHECGHDTLTDEQKAVEKMLSQSEVNEIVGKTRTETRDRTLKDVYSRFGVNDDNELDNLFAKSQSYDTLKDESDSIINQMKNELGEVKSKIAMYESNIAPERYEDVKLILKGKGMDITAENINSEIATHPEWKKVEEVKEMISKNENPAEGNFVKRSMPKKSIEVLGNERPEATQSGPSERDIAMSLYGL